MVKLVTNQLWFIAAAAIGEGFALGVRHGVDLEILYSAIRQSVGDSFVASHDAPSIFAGHYDPSFTLDLCLKDLRLIRGLQQDLDVELPMTEAARGAFEVAADRYGPDAAELLVAKRIEEDAGLSFRLPETGSRRGRSTTTSRRPRGRGEGGACREYGGTQVVRGWSVERHGASSNEENGVS